MTEEDEEDCKEDPRRYLDRRNEEFSVDVMYWEVIFFANALCLSLPFFFFLRPPFAFFRLLCDTLLELSSVQFEFAASLLFKVSSFGSLSSLVSVSSSASAFASLLACSSIPCSAVNASTKGRKS